MFVDDSEPDSDGEEERERESKGMNDPTGLDFQASEEPTVEAEPTPELAFEEVTALAEARLRDALAQIDALRTAVQRGRARVEAELLVQRRRATTAEERVRQAETTHRELVDVLEEQRIASAELTTILRAAEYRLAQLEKIVETREAEIASLRESQAGEAEHARTLRSQIEALVEKDREASAERERLKQIVHAAEDERSTLAQQLKESRSRLTRRQGEIDRLNAQLKEARERDALRSAEAGAPASPVGDGVDTAANLARMAEMEAALATARRRGAAQEEELSRGRARIEELEEILAKEQASRRAIEQSFERGQADLEERTRVCEMLAYERSELQTQINALRLESEQAGRDLADAQQLRDQGGEQRSLMEARISELERALQASQEHEGILQATVAELQEVLQGEQAASSLLRADTQNRERIRQMLERELLEARAHWSDLEVRQQAQLQQHILELAKSNERSRMLEIERDNLHEQVVNLAAARDRLERESEQLRRRVEMEKQKSEMARLQAKLEEVELRHPDAMVGKNAGAAYVAPPAMRSGAPGPSLAVSSGATAEVLPNGLSIIAIGASTGGPAVLSALLPQFPQDVKSCFLIIQHMPPGYTAELASCLAQQAQIKVAEARHGDPLLPGVAYVAPGGHHMEVRGGRVRLTSSPPVNKHRPSVDVLFGSLVPMAKRVCAVLLSGMGNDGVAGMSRLHAAGAETVVQDEASSVVWGMPGAAVQAGCADRQMSPAELSRFLVARAMCEQVDGQENLASPNAVLRFGGVVA